MEALTLKELKKIEKWYATHEEDMDSSDNKIYEKINMIIEDMEETIEEDASIKTSLYDEDPEDDLEEDREDCYYQEFGEEDEDR
jgi:cell wall assembly regulator SMI1